MRKPIRKRRHLMSDSLAVRILSAPIKLYRAALSPLLPNSCRFTPSCSAYALEALKIHGPVTGLLLTARRLLRCHPITWLGGSSGFDPVPLQKTPAP
jgi:putative membrane protein insertion efficiency factor